jgi:methyl-accepting chemotaxis protein
MQTQKLEKEIEKIYNDNLLSINYLIEADRDAYQASIAIMHAVSDDEAATNPQRLNTLIGEVHENLGQVIDRYEQFYGISALTQNTANDEYDIHHENFQKNFEVVMESSDEIVLHLENREFEEAANVYYEKYRPAYTPMRLAMDEYTNLSLTAAEDAYHAGVELSNGIFNNSMLVVGAVFIFIVLGGIFLKSSISRPLNEAMAIVDKMAVGDLNINVDRNKYNKKDQIGFLLFKMDEMAQSIRKVILAVRNGADYINRASVELSTSAGQLSEGASLQASSVEEVSSSMEEMAANIMQNTDNAKETESIAKKTNGQVENSNNAVLETVDSMNVIVRKNSIIGEIARQTNLLALNAAVEAARAGEHGRGFAVVASEIRKLAERSQNAAKEIDDISNSSEKVARNAGDMLKLLVPEIEKTANLVAEITSASLEQNDGANQINDAIQQLNSVVQQNAASAEELASNSKELNYQADVLKKAISFFKIDKNDAANDVKLDDINHLAEKTQENWNNGRNGNSHASESNGHSQNDQNSENQKQEKRKKKDRDLENESFKLVLDSEEDNLDKEFTKY